MWHGDSYYSRPDNTQEYTHSHGLLFCFLFMHVGACTTFFYATRDQYFCIFCRCYSRHTLFYFSIFSVKNCQRMISQTPLLAFFKFCPRYFMGMFLLFFLGTLSLPRIFTPSNICGVFTPLCTLGMGICFRGSQPHLFLRHGYRDGHSIFLSPLF